MTHIYPKYILTCHEVTEHGDDTFSFNRVFESLKVIGFPVKLDFNLVLGIDYSLTKKDNRMVSISIVDQDNKRVDDRIFEIELKHTSKKNSIFTINVIKIVNFHVERENQYSILVHHKGQLLASHDIYVTGEEGK
jgi:hypothetical protein